MAPFTGNPTQAQMVAMAITPKISGLLSMLGSGYIVRDCLRQLKSGERGRGGTVTTSSGHIYQRLMIGMSISDMIMSFGFVLSTLLAPKDTPNMWGNIGNTQSCTFSGMFNLFGVTPTLYNGSLSIYYLLRIRNGWTQSQLQNVEKWLHGIPWIWGISVVIASLALKLLNSGLFECWLAPFPQGCVSSYKATEDNPGTCTRGDNIELYQWGFDTIPKLMSIFIVTINMYLTWYSIYQQEKQTLRFSMGSMAARRESEYAADTDSNEDGDGKPARRSIRRPSQARRPSQVIKLSVAQRLARQSYFYVGALYVTYIPVVTARINEAVTGFVHWEMLYTICLLVPLQGFWNAFVYLRPRYLQYRKDEMKRMGQAGESTNNSRWFSSTRSSDAEGSPKPATPLAPAGHRNIFQTFGDAFRDGAIDDEAELDELEVKKAERAAKLTAATPSDDAITERTEPTRVSFWSTGDNSKPMQPSSTADEDEVLDRGFNEAAENGPDDGSALSEDPYVTEDEQADENEAHASADELLSSLVNESKPFDPNMHFF
ncbi:hypothetical protein MPSEU_000180300 [Mayamaea pseudoterrestris]|nr:hypothetical protein MPSEU_000180300 [Mayamaea pseudoterrestris]